MKSRIAAGIMVVVLLAGAVGGVWYAKKLRTQPAGMAAGFEPAETVQVVTAHTAPFRKMAQLSGTVVPLRAVTLATEVSGVVKEILFRAAKRTATRLVLVANQPLHMADQVMLIYAGGRGYLDKIPVNRVQESKGILLSFLRDEKSEIRKAIIDSNALDDATEELLKKALEEFVVRWQETEAKK